MRGHAPMPCAVVRVRLRVSTVSRRLTGAVGGGLGLIVTREIDLALLVDASFRHRKRPGGIDRLVLHSADVGVNLFPLR